VRGYLESLVSKFGRKYTLSIMAGSSAFLVTVAGLWITARVGPQTGEIVADVVKAYLLAAPVIAGAYAASNGLVEMSHAKAGSATPKAAPSQTARASGTVQQPPDNGVI
jgi:hypothetical protein